MRVPHRGGVPAAMQKRLDALCEAVDALPPTMSSPVADPIFGNGTRPCAPAIPANLPPALAVAFSSLQAALDGPPCLGDKWPFANPPTVQAAIDAQKKQVGRPSAVQPNQIVRLVRFVKLGHSIRQAADKAGLTPPTAARILKGNHPLAKHPAVAAAGVDLPLAASPCVSKPVRNHQEGTGRAAALREGDGVPPAPETPIGRVVAINPAGATQLDACVARFATGNGAIPGERHAETAGVAA